MKNLKLTAILIITLANLLIATLAFSQSVGISGEYFSIDSSAILEVKSTQKGVLFPRMTTEQRDSISDGYYGYNAALSLLIYNTTTNCYEFYAYGDWYELGCAVAESGCGGQTTMTDSRDSKVYNIVEIGGVCWMAENLNYGTYVTIATGQSGAGTQKYCYSDNTANCTTYGGLYEWTEVMNGSSSCNGTGESQPACSSPVQGICPSGWHLPSHYEWVALERAMCTSSCTTNFPYDVTTAGWRGTDEGGKLKETGTTHWTSPNTGATDSENFTALPGGNSWSGSFSYVASYGFWWSATEYDSTYAWGHNMSYNYATVERSNYNKASGFSVRCVKD